jgi:hypothetical protein
MSTPTRRSAAAAAGLVALAVLTAPATATARPDPGTTVQASPAPAETACQLRRIGDQLVVCDNLTGAGVTAPPWVPEAGAVPHAYTGLSAPATDSEVQTLSLRRPGRGAAAQP